MGRSKAIGTRHETAVVGFLENYGIKARRVALAGNKDCGDVEIEGTVPCMMEVKSGKQTANPNRLLLAEWMRQASVEARNSGKPCVLCVVRYNRRIKDAEVYFKWHGLVARMYLDEFAQFIKYKSNIRKIE